MARVTIEDCLKENDNRFSLVHLAAKRAKDLIKGKRPKVEGYKNKQAVLALREIAHGRVAWRENVESLLKEDSESDNLF